MQPGISTLRRLFEEASEIAHVRERTAFLDSACGRNPDLRRRVDDLIAAQAAAGRFLPERPGTSRVRPESGDPEGRGEMARTAPVRFHPGERIGPYRLLEKLGEGGCGVVYLAEQAVPLRREVALKVLKLGMDTESVVARFDAERQALALMDHPNIAKILDAGATESGRPYFAMDLVRGTRITHYCARHQLSTRARLELFLQVCQAVQHAHQKGIIHRDLKPSNVLVAVHEHAVIPKVIDFGIAEATEGRLTDHTLFTALDQLVGTPAYMSPEQAARSDLDVDTRTDIYSLGVLLYELLTGQTPFDNRALLAQGLDGMRRTIRERTPVRPSSRMRPTEGAEPAADVPSMIPTSRSKIDPDLDWIVLKCLEKERERRYQAASELGSDIERHLRCEPVAARPPSLLYTLRKTVVRNKLAFAGAMTAVGALCFGLVVSQVEAARARRAEADQARLRTLEQRARRHADVQERMARQRAYAADMNRAQQAVAAEDLGLARELLQYHRPGRGQEDLRDWEWWYLYQGVQSDALGQLCQKSNTIASLAVSRDGQWLAIGEFYEGRLSVWDLRCV